MLRTFNRASAGGIRWPLSTSAAIGSTGVLVYAFRNNRGPTSLLILCVCVTLIVTLDCLRQSYYTALFGNSTV